MAMIESGFASVRSSARADRPQAFDPVTANTDEHGVLADPDNRLRLNDRLKLVPGHCDPTCNLHDWYVGVRGHRVECLWPVSARGRSY